MSLWSELLEEVYVVTNRPDLVNETAIALRKVTRNLHNSGRYWRDLAIVTVSSVAIEQVQEIELATAAPNFRKLAYVEVGVNSGNRLAIVGIDELLDLDDYQRINICWGLGNVLKLRAETPSETFTVAYYQYPVTYPTDSYATWIAAEHRDLIVLKTALAVLALVGESEITKNLVSLAGELQRDLVAQSIEIVSR